MPESYHKLGKKSIVAWLLALALFLVYSDAVLAKIPNDPRYNAQEQIYNQIGAPDAWEYTTGASNVVVAVIDTGVDINNEDLKNNIWRNTKEIFGNAVDDDGNGYIDDINGWNFVEHNNDVSISVIQESNDSGAVNHGTILAGLIGAEGDNSVLGTGLNWSVKIMPLRAIDSNGNGVLADVAKAVNYAVDNGADIISISFVGASTYPELTDSLFRAYKKGVLVVAAAGNSRNDSSGNENLSKVKQYPVCLDSDSSENWILGVGSVDRKDQLSVFGDYGSCIDISAPGERIFSTQKYAPQYGYIKNFDGAWNGTSFSAPLVAGSAALIKSIRPDWGAKEIMANLLRSAEDIDGLNPGFAGQMGYGRLNIGKAVAIAFTSKNAPPPLPVVWTSKLISNKKTSIVQVAADGKVLREFTLVNYLPKLSRWAVKDNLFVYARLEKNKVIVEAWDLAGNKKLSNFILAGLSSLSDLKIENLWGYEPNIVLFVKKGKVSQKIIVDISSKSWKVE